MVRLNNRQRNVLKLIAVNFLLLCLALIWDNSNDRSNVAMAVAKSKQMLDLNMMSAPALDALTVKQIALSDPGLAAASGDSELEFINAVRLSFGESRYWQDEGCSGVNCAHVTFYDYEQGGTVEAVVNLERAAIIGHWTNKEARPAGSSHILPKALAIAAQDEQVRSILGDIGAADPAMVPMSGWLTDDDCADEWCVDLTFHDPNGSGRIFHVFVNMERDRVARTFYTRGRPEREAAKPVAQRNAFSDGCNEQYGWEVCWEMTASDGVNFRDATYDGQLIFSSAKIGQVEAWYPSWPGGYRDEIGFTASVPPFGDTVIDDFGDGFAVRQLFTEFTNWPNCICCYRYEEIVSFYEDGRVEFRFVSHGPGCDDLSVYRPFWRIDIDLNGPENDSVWLWEDTSWDESLVEFETYPVVEDLSPDGYKLATFDEDLHYRWLMERTDPLRLDEGYLFLLQFNEKEGEGLITTGPGDTYIPPRQWINGDPLSGENIVLWWVPLLNTKKGGPYWCQPDPEPAFSPCEAILRAEPAGDLRQPTVEELATVQPTPKPVTSPTPTSTPAPTATPRPIDGAAAEEVILNAGCGSCHKIGLLGEGHKVGPDLSDIGLTAGENSYGLSAEQYIRQAILDPNAILAEQCPNGPCLANIMPRDYETRLLPQQIDALVDFLMAQQQKDDSLATPEFAPETDTQAASKAFPAPKNAKRPLQSGSINSTLVVQILLLSLVFLLSLLLFFKGSADD